MTLAVPGLIAAERCTKLGTSMAPVINCHRYVGSAVCCTSSSEDISVGDGILTSHSNGRDPLSDVSPSCCGPSPKVPTTTSSRDRALECETATAEVIGIGRAG